MVFGSRKEHFLSNLKNRQAFVILLGNTLESSGYSILHAEGDADILIVKTSIECSANIKAIIIAEDTDLLVLLCFHARLKDKPIFLYSDKQTNHRQKVWHIQRLKQSLGLEVCQYLPFIHAVNGCDTTSRLFGIGKGHPLNLLKIDQIFKQQAQIFSTKDQAPDTIIAAGEVVLISLYKGCATESLDTLRFKRFCEKVSVTATLVEVKSLPTNASAAKYHSLRVYLQVQEWITDLQPVNWEWQLSSGHLEPITRDLPLAPKALLMIIRCNCKKDCQTKRCTCRKHGLKCSVACGGCKGLSCTITLSSELIENEFADTTFKFQ